MQQLLQDIGYTHMGIEDLYSAIIERLDFLDTENREVAQEGTQILREIDNNNKHYAYHFTSYGSGKLDKMSDIKESLLFTLHQALKKIEEDWDALTKEDVLKLVRIVEGFGDNVNTSYDDIYDEYREDNWWFAITGAEEDEVTQWDAIIDKWKEFRMDADNIDKLINKY